ncbi:hypothetical protein GOODEAATRI_009524 [Goodea atripinnis]|uniref:PX domain-containing protein n=1 Tax=Goodea atripinnis TaxID=208336 RepID=A0ABV0PCS9_9TELE
MAARLLDRLKRSLFKDGQGAEPDQDAEGGPEAEGFSKDCWEAELEEEEECLTEQLRGTLCFDGGEFGAEEGGEGMDSDSDFLGECQSSRRVPIWPLPFFHADSAGSGQLEELPRTRRSESWPRCEATDGRLAVRGDGRQRGAGRRLQIRGQFLFNAEISARSINNQTRSEKIRLVLSLQLYTIHVIQSGGSDKTPAVITHRYSDFQRLHATLRRNYGDQMERVSFPRKQMRCPPSGWGLGLISDSAQEQTSDFNVRREEAAQKLHG